jgi:hypothetical protein
MPPFQDTLAFQVDFNNFDDDGKLLKGSLWHGSSRRIPRVGERAILQDGEGNRCWGKVCAVRGVIIHFALEDATWVSGEQSRTITFDGPMIASLSVSGPAGAPQS